MFQMGVPVSGKNLFPSNISGLPTWFIIRASDQGYQAPGDKAHIQVLMNKDTWHKDLAGIPSLGAQQFHGFLRLSGLS
jgi:2-oxoglutarate ferredoxin oxidoreductase subunit alpha